MQENNMLQKMVLIFVLLLWGWASLEAQETFKEFRAEISNTDALGKTLEGRIYVRPWMIRLEFGEGEEAIVLIKRLDQGLVWSLLAGNTYLEMPLSFEPAFPELQAGVKYERLELGFKEFNGFKAKVIEYHYREPQVCRARLWLALELGFPIKLEVRDTQGKLLMAYELKGIILASQKVELFEVPESYAKLDFHF